MFSTPINMAFQPIVDVIERTTFAHEALVRGQNGASAKEILATVNTNNRHAFDQLCRITALESASRLRLSSFLCINFMPNAVVEPETCMNETAEVARRLNWPLTRIILEVSENEALLDFDHWVKILSTCRAHGVLTAIDDFGAAYAGLNLLADFQPDFLKLDIGLVRGVAHDKVRQIIVRHTVNMCNELGIGIVAEGVEIRDDSAVLAEFGVRLQQGNLFARPCIDRLPVVKF